MGVELALLRFGTIFALSTKNNLYLCTPNKKFMAYTITITSNSPQALAFVEYLKTLSFVEFTETQSKEKAPAKAKAKAGLAKPEPRVYNEQQKKFKKMLIEGLNAVEEHKKGTGKFQSLEEVLKEL